MGSGDSTMDSHTIKWLGFTEDYPAWSTKFLEYIKQKDCIKSLLDKEVFNSRSIHSRRKSRMGSSSRATKSTN